MKWNRDFSIVIAHRGPWMGLWMTINSCEMALQSGNGTSKYDYEYIVVINGETKLPQDFWMAHGRLRMDRKIRLVIHPEPLSPPGARMMGTMLGDSDYIFFFDNHCMVRPDYFDRAMETLKKYDCDLLHSSFRFHSRYLTDHHYELKLDKNFWAMSSPNPQSATEPYRCAASGHGGFAVKRSSWNEVGGYWNGFRGYAGEELYCDLKMWQLGKTVWIDPKMIHYHFAGERPYQRHFSDDYYRNLMMCANIIGGQKHLDTVYQHFAKQTKFGDMNTNMFDLYLDAADKSSEHAKELHAKRRMDLDQLLEFFRAENIPH